MSGDAVIPGSVVEWDGFINEKGEKEPKLFVIVGAHADKNYLAIKATSKKKWRDYQPADGANYYYLPGGRLEFFNEDTWILFTEQQEFNRVGFEREMKAGKLRTIGCLRFQLANEICNKMRKCEDISPLHIELLGPPLQDPNKEK